MKQKSTPTIRSSFLAVGAIALAVSGVAASRLVETPRTPPPSPDAHGLPALVFVARHFASENRQVPGFGPRGRTWSTGGSLMVRSKTGALSSLVRDVPFFDVADPAVSWDARRIAFAGRETETDPWRIYSVNADGSAFRQLTRSDRAIDLDLLGTGAATRFADYDDFDPCWLPDGRVVFASTRFPQLSQEGGYPVSNLFVVNADGSKLQRITSERNGGEEPTIDPSGRILYSRWFFNPYLASDSGLTMDRALAAPADEVDAWQLVSIFPDGDRIELAAGELGVPKRRGAYQASVERNGRIVAVQPIVGSMVPAPMGTRLVRFGGVLGIEPVAIGPEPGYSVSPAALPDGRVLFSYAVGASAPGPFELDVLSKDSKRFYVLALPGYDILDAVPLVKRKVPPVIGPQGGIDDPAWTLPVTRLDQVRRGDDTFRFDCLNVYLTGPVDSPFPDAPRIAKGARIRFFAALSRPEAATGDTVVLVRDAKLEPSGAVHESDIPGDVPLFEQLVDENGRLMRSAHGPAHVPGSNFSRIGSGTKCVGCHEGHSALPVPKNNYEAKWFNASTSATPTVSSGAGADQLVDRRAKGTVGWVADGPEGQWARLTWPLAVEARSVVLYASSNPRRALHIRECQLVFFRDGQEVGRASAGDVKAGGTRIDFPPVRLDALEVRPTRVTGGGVALAEIETIARMIE